MSAPVPCLPPCLPAPDRILDGLATAFEAGQSSGRIPEVEIGSGQAPPLHPDLLPILTSPPHSP